MAKTKNQTLGGSFIKDAESVLDMTSALVSDSCPRSGLSKRGNFSCPLSHFHERLSKIKKVRNPIPLISIAVDIAYSSPRTFPVCAAIISKVLRAVKTRKERVRLIEKIHTKLSQLPNTGHMEVWLQRISYPYKNRIALAESLCQVVDGNKVQIWNNDWISTKKLLVALDPKNIVDERKLKAAKPVVKPAEIRVFAYERY
jgi:hypothetical protein